MLVGPGERAIKDWIVDTDHDFLKAAAASTDKLILPLIINLVLLAALFVAATSQEPFANVGNWFVYNEEKSCVMYLDIASPLFEERRVDRLFVNMVSKKWSDLGPYVGRSVIFSFQFPNKSVVGNGSLAQVIDNGDGSFGYAGGENLGVDEMLDGIAKSYSVIVNVCDPERPRMKGTIEAFPIFITYSHGAAAVALLKECSIQR